MSWKWFRVFVRLFVSLCFVLVIIFSHLLALVSTSLAVKSAADGTVALDPTLRIPNSPLVHVFLQEEKGIDPVVSFEISSVAL